MNIRMVKETDIQQLLQWSKDNADKNGFDPATLLYPTTDIVAVENGNGPIVFLPVHNVGMLESIAPSPEASKEELSRAILKAVAHIAIRGRTRGVRELYFLASDPELASLAERAGFEKCDWPAYKLRLGEP